jgi:hypothetical protein
MYDLERDSSKVVEVLAECWMMWRVGSSCIVVLELIHILISLIDSLLMVCTCVRLFTCTARAPCKAQLRGHASSMHQ